MDLNLIFQKYDPDTYLCFAACCKAEYGVGLCGTVQIVTDSNTTDRVSEGYVSELEKVSVDGAYYSYLIYAHLPLPGNAIPLKRSRAQFNIFSGDSARNPAATFNLFITPAQYADNLFSPRYWLIACASVSDLQVWSYKSLNNATASQFSTIEPDPSLYC